MRFSLNRHRRPHGRQVLHPSGEIAVATVLFHGRLRLILPAT
jgi:hypothetical protein